MIYFCHIPKTSGSSIEACMRQYENKIKFHQNKTSFSELSESQFRDHLMKRKDDHVLIGHFAATPFEMFPDVKGYSIVRNPIERLLSTFRYSQTANNWKQPFKEILFSYLTGKQSRYPSIGHDGRSNMQSLFLTQPLEWREENKFIASVRHADISFSDVLSIIKKNNTTLSTMDNRNYILSDINLELINNTGYSVIFDSKIKVNENPFKMDVMDLICEFYDEIHEANKLDFELYNYIRAHEAKFARALRPSDIII